MEYELYDVIIVGAGASGLVCAIECARAGLNTLVLEKDPQPARKIMVSGNGRCNLTNRHVAPNAYQADPALIETTLQQFSFQDCCHYFEDLGVLLTEEAQGRVFPACGKSTAVTEALKAELKELDIDIRYNQTVTNIRAAAVQFIVTTRSKDVFHAHNLVLACGSCAYPQATGTDMGYQLAQSLKHTVITPRPVLTGLCLKERACSRLSGMKCQVRTTVKNKPQAQAEGEVIFTNYGMNGPAALNISSVVSRELANGPVPIEVNFLPQLKDPHTFLQARLEDFGYRKPKDFFIGLLHDNLINLLLDFTGLKKNTPLQEQNAQRVFDTLLAWPLTVTAMRPWQEAMAATGGVKTSEINYNTFESKLYPGLFITGELLDVDGKSGGFNLHFAWASGFIAAHCIIKEK